MLPSISRRLTLGTYSSPCRTLTTTLLRKEEESGSISEKWTRLQTPNPLQPKPHMRRKRTLKQIHIDIPKIRKMAYLLRHGNALPMREDGFVRVEDLLRHRDMQNSSFLDIERILKRDGKKSIFELVQQPTHVEAPEGDPALFGTWWIRAKENHSLPYVTGQLQRVFSPTELPVVVHGTTEGAWERISIEGISRMDRRYIQLGASVENAHVVNGMQTSSEILIYIDIAKALSADILFYRTPDGTIVTEGNEAGFLTPRFFQRVERVEVTKILVTGWELPDFRAHSNQAGLNGQPTHSGDEIKSLPPHLLHPQRR
ncbi:hypothetical protein HGRIS_004085 [Hohenbuehelia grisea]|uniref:2'-phosphotransferase n=1 Tax=Hohenbuehelia grisea TaxID=104357 RepID=A0ABR3JIL8_9AGAR